MPERVTYIENKCPERLQAWTMILFTVWLLCAYAVLPNPAAADSGSLDLVFAIDDSGSMRTHDPDFLTHQMVLDFAEALREAGEQNARMGLVRFERDAEILLPLTPVVSTKDVDRVATQLSKLTFQGQRTNTPAGIERALYELEHNGRRDGHRAIVFLTDGFIDTGDRARDQEGARWLREELGGASANAGIRVYGVAFTDSADFQLIQSLAQRTDGRYHRAASAKDLAAVVDAILADLKTRRPVESDPGERVPPLALAALDLAPSQRGERPAVSAMRKEAAGSRLIDPIHLLLPLAGILLAAASAIAWRNRADRAGPHRPRPRQDPPTRTHRRARVLAQLVDASGVTGRGPVQLSRHQRLVSVGRDEHNDLVVGRRTVSSFHATIELRDGYYYIEDRRSTNGTWLNDERLDANVARQLKGGDELRFADFRFLFLIPDHQPAGETAILRSTELEPGVAAASHPPHERTRFAEPDPPDPRQPDSALQLPQAAPESPLSGAHEANLFSDCLDAHLHRVRDLGAPFARFVDGQFSTDLRAALAAAARDLMLEARTEQRCTTRSYPSQGVVYVLCIVPDAMDKAAEWFGRSFGGFSQLLTRHLSSDSFRNQGASALCVITFGRGERGWLSMTIAAAPDNPDPIDLLSYEFLSDEERRALDADPIGSESASPLTPARSDA